jgi:hypothetical protein
MFGTKAHKKQVPRRIFCGRTDAGTSTSARSMASHSLNAEWCMHQQTMLCMNPTHWCTPQHAHSTGTEADLCALKGTAQTAAASSSSGDAVTLLPKRFAGCYQHMMKRVLGSFIKGACRCAGKVTSCNDPAFETPLLMTFETTLLLRDSRCRCTSQAAVKLESDKHE